MSYRFSHKGFFATPTTKQSDMPPIDAQKLVRLIEKYSDKSSEIKADEGLTLFIGNTGSGKTTTIRYLLGHKLERRRVMGRMMIVPVDDTDDSLKVGTGIHAQTLYPVIKGDKSHEFHYCDTAGFFDNRTLEEKICASVTMEMTIRQAISVRAVVVVINAHDLASQKGESFIELGKTISKLFRDPQQLREHIIPVVTQLSSDEWQEGREALERDLVERFNQFYHHYQDKVDSVADRSLWGRTRGWLIGFNKVDQFEKNSQKLNEYRNACIIFQLLQESRPIALDALQPEGAELIRQRIRECQVSGRLTVENFNFDDYDTDRLVCRQAIYEAVGNSSVRIDEYFKCDKEVGYCKQTLEQTKQNEKFLEDELKKRTAYLESEQDIAKKQQIASLNNRIASKEVAIRGCEDRLAGEISTIEKLNEELEKIDSEVEELFWKSKRAKKVSGWFRFARWIEENFKYPGETCGKPFTRYMIEKSPKGVHKITNENKENGILEVSYSGDYGEDGYACIAVYGERRHKNDNKIRIVQARKLLGEAKGRRAQLERNIQELKTENVELESTLASYRNDVKFSKDQQEEQQRKYEKSLGKSQKDIERYTSKFDILLVRRNDMIKELKSNLAYYTLVERLIDLLQIDGSCLVQSYLRSCEKLRAEMPLSLGVDEKVDDEKAQGQKLLYEDAPEHFKCSLTGKLMRDPVVAEDGYCYERSEIIQHLRKQMRYLEEQGERRDCVVMNGKKISIKSLRDERRLKQAIEQYRGEKIRMQQADGKSEGELLEQEVMLKEKIKNLESELEKKHAQLRVVEQTRKQLRDNSHIRSDSEVDEPSSSGPKP